MQIKSLKNEFKKLYKIRLRREELFKYYKDKQDQFIVRSELSDRNGQYEEKQINLEDEKRRRLMLELETFLPKRLVKIQHNDPLRILAFSDYRVHDIDMLLDFVKNLNEKPDLILYAGDDVDRFVRPPLELLTIPTSFGEYPDEIELAYFRASEWSMVSHNYGLTLRLPKHMDYEAAKIRVSNILKMVRRIKEIIKNENKQHQNNGLEKIRELLKKDYPSMKIVNNNIRPADNDTNIMDIVDKSTGTRVLHLELSTHSGEVFARGGYDRLLDNSNATPNIIDRIGFDKKYVYYFITYEKQYMRNYFEELAHEARYGLAAIIGNDDLDVVKYWIKGKNVYELQNSWLKIGSFLIMGQEGSTDGYGPFNEYLEGDVKLRLELAQEMLRVEDKMIIVSHTPPRGILDRAFRYDDRAIGSLALRDFIEENQKVSLVICGHVHRNGGKYESLDKVTIANVSSHDDALDRANIAWIVLNETGDADIKMMKLPSPIEQVFKEEDENDWLESLQSVAWLSTSEAALLIESYKKHGEPLFDDISDLVVFKSQYGFSWDNIFKLYDHGVKTVDQITDAVYKKVLEQSSGLYKMHLKKAYMKVRREKEKGTIYLTDPFPIPSNSKLVAFDTEYSTKGVLYGFLDLNSGELRQFWFDEKEKAREYLSKKKDYLFINWGGADRKLLREELYCDAPTVDLLYYVQTSLIAPIQSATLEEVHDTLCGHKDGKLWERSFYTMDGLYKRMLCNKILDDPNDLIARKELAEANRADNLALGDIIKSLQKIPVH